MEPGTFERFREPVYQRSGTILGLRKVSMVRARIADAEVRRRLVGEICRLLRPGGHLIVGHSESLLGLDAPLAGVRPSIYRKLAP